MSTPAPIDHPAIVAYCDHLTAAGKARTAAGYRIYLRWFAAWTAARCIDLIDATPDDLTAYQVHLAQERRKQDGNPLARSTQATAIITVRSLYDWLHRRNIIVFDPAARIIPPKPPATLTVATDHLSVDESLALLGTLSDAVAEARPRTTTWAIACRDLTAISLALATGRRCAGLTAIRVADIDRERAEVRVSWEKGKAGRVLPVAAWAMALVAHYIDHARPLLLGATDSPALFPTIRAQQMTPRAFDVVLQRAIAATIQRHPDLTSLAAKRISTHSLRVTFAVTLFAHGCGIRSLNELLLHASLSTTARYTPIPLEEMRRLLLAHHPRA